MNRSNFLALFGLLPFAAKAQKINATNCHAGTDGQVVCFGESSTNGTGIILGDSAYRRPKPKNGVCPTCGTMAGGWLNPITMKCATGICRNVPAGKTSEITRCLHCNAAFWQDLE